MPSRGIRRKPLCPSSSIDFVQSETGHIESAGCKMTYGALGLNADEIIGDLSRVLGRCTQKNTAGRFRMAPPRMRANDMSLLDADV